MAIISIDEAIAKKQQSSGNGIVPIDEAIARKQPASSGNGELTEADFGSQVNQNAPSPLRLDERMVLSFADDPGRETFLKRRYNYVERLENGKYAVGNDPRSLAPIDPEGTFNDVMGDLADTVASIPVIAGQIGGALAGTAAAPGVGTVVGGGTGAAAGRAVSQHIGESMGVYNADAWEKATDLAITGAFGAVGEGLGVAMKAGVPQQMIQKAGRALGRFLKFSPQSMPTAAKILPKVFKITADVPEEATTIVLKDGAENVFTPSNMNPTHVRTVVDDIQKAIVSQKETLGHAVNQTTGEIVRATKGKPVLEMRDLITTLTSDLKQAGFLGRGNVIQPYYLGEGRDATVFRNLLSQLSDPRVITKPKLDRFGRVVGKQSLKAFQFPSQGYQVTAREALVLRNQLANSFDDLSPAGQRIIGNFLRGNGTTIGLAGRIEDVATRAGATKFAAANAQFSEYLDLLTDLKQAGFDHTNTAAMENSVKGFFKSSQTTKFLVEQLSNRVQGDVLGKMARYSAAQAFTNANPNILRFGFVAGLFGMSQAKTTEGRIAGLSTALLFGSPAGVRMLLTAGAKLQRTTGAAASAASRAQGPSQERVGRALLGRGLQRFSGQKQEQRER